MAPGEYTKDSLRQMRRTDGAAAETTYTGTLRVLQGSGLTLIFR